jgi:hypothetical protein
MKDEEQIRVFGSEMFYISVLYYLFVEYMLMLVILLPERPYAHVLKFA